MEENQSQNETPNLSKKSEEINDINDSPDNQAKDTSQSNITNDLLPAVRTNYIFNQNLTIYFYKIIVNKKKKISSKNINE
jgi:beta-lactam-binding protein with PASTA domain